MKKSTELPGVGYSDKALLLVGVENNNPGQVQLLLSYGAEPNNPWGSWDGTPLYIASRQGYTAVAEAPLSHENIEVDIFTQWSNAILVAGINHHAEMVKMLLARGAHTPPVSEERQVTPLNTAIENGMPDVARLLVNRDDVDPNALLCGRITPLQLAVYENREDMVEMLLSDKRVNLDLKVGYNDINPLYAAALKKNDVIVQLLLDAGADRTVEHYAGVSPAMLLEATTEHARHIIQYEAIRKHKARGGAEEIC